MKRFLMIMTFGLVLSVGLFGVSNGSTAHAAPPVAVSNPGSAQSSTLRPGLYCSRGLPQDNQWCMYNPYFEWRKITGVNYWIPVICVHPNNLIRNGVRYTFPTTSQTFKIPLYAPFTTGAVLDGPNIAPGYHPSVHNIQLEVFVGNNDSDHGGSAGLCGYKIGSKSVSVHFHIGTEDLVFDGRRSMEYQTVLARRTDFRSFQNVGSSTRILNWNHFIANPEKDFAFPNAQFRDQVGNSAAGNAFREEGQGGDPPDPGGGDPPPVEDPDPPAPIDDDDDKLPPGQPTPVWVINWPEDWLDLGDWGDLATSFGQSIANQTAQIGGFLYDLGQNIVGTLVSLPGQIVSGIGDLLGSMFVPDELFVEGALEDIQLAIDDSAVGDIIEGVEAWGAVFDLEDSSQCAGPLIELELMGAVSYSDYPLSACDEPMKTYATMSHMFIGFVGVMGAVFAIVRMFARVFDYDGVGKVGASS